MIMTLILVALIVGNISFFVFAPASRPDFFKPEYSTVDLAAIFGLYACMDAIGPSVRGAGVLLTIAAVAGTAVVMFLVCILVTRYRYKWWYEAERRGVKSLVEDESV